jgi:tRNA(Ile)-lysidine synthase
MQIAIEPGTYVVAVSGGVDSMVLLDLLHGQKDIEVVVAHFDHGIREDSAEDRQLVQSVAAELGLPFVYADGHLGKQTSEATARQARYDFLRATAREYGAQAIITAHHQDDMLETAVINLLRGTNRRGLSSLKSGGDIVRPLLTYSKAELRQYARAHNLKWREDSTNQDKRYLRNYIRYQLLARFTEADRQRLIQVLADSAKHNQELEVLLDTQLVVLEQDGSLNRQQLTHLPHAIAREIIATWLRKHGVTFDKTTLERLVVAAKTSQPGNRIDVVAGWQMQVSKTTLALRHPER